MKGSGFINHNSKVHKLWHFKTVKECWKWAKGRSFILYVSFS